MGLYAENPRRRRRSSKRRKAAKKGRRRRRARRSNPAPFGGAPRRRRRKGRRRAASRRRGRGRRRNPFGFGGGGGGMSVLKTALGTVVGMQAGHALANFLNVKTPLLEKIPGRTVDKVAILGALLAMFGRKVPVIGRYLRPIGVGMFIKGVDMALGVRNLDGAGLLRKAGLTGPDEINLGDTGEYGMLGLSGLGGFMTVPGLSDSDMPQGYVQGY